MSVRVVRGEITAADTTTRTVLPSVTLPRWAPFERIAERIATPRRRSPPHHHVGVEVLTYVIEGSGSYEFGTGPHDPLVAGSTDLLTAPTSVPHAITPGKGQTVRWFAVVATMPPGAATESRLQSGRAKPTDLQPEGTVVQHLVGPGSQLTSAMGLESETIAFRSAGASFRKVGHDRVAVNYVLAGRGSIDNEVLDAGEAALVEEAAGVALVGEPGFHVVLVSAPRPG